MARVATEIKKVFLRVIWDNAQKAGLSLPEALLAFAVARFNEIQDGKVIIQSTGAGYSGTWESPSLKIVGGINPGDIASLSEELIERAEIARNQLEVCAKYGLDIDDIDEGGPPSTLPPAVANPYPVTDAQVVARMLAQFVPTTESRNDYWYQRCGGVITI